MTIQPRRSALYSPASNARALEKARGLDCDVLIIDLEDAVAPDAKEAARANACTAVAIGEWGSREVVVRVNALDTPWGADDLAALVRVGVETVLVPKVSSALDITAYRASLPGDTAIWAMIETCASLFALGEIAGADRVECLVVGTNDLAKEMRCTPDPSRAVFQPFLAQTVAAARAHGIAALDGVCNSVTDLDAFEAEAAHGKAFGFDGKTLIHPAQVEPANRIFAPTSDEIARARAVIEAFELPENAGAGVIVVDGAMTERLHLAQARETIAIASAIAARG